MSGLAWPVAARDFLISVAAGVATRQSVRVEVPEFVTHYYRANRRPFLSLSNVQEDELSNVLRVLQNERRTGEHHRVFGQKYVAMRRIAETRLREQFVHQGGRPERSTPHYFILEESPWFRGLAADMQAIRLPIAALPSDQTSVTYGDSFETTGVAADFGYGSADRRSYHDRVFRLDELPSLLGTLGLRTGDAEADYEGYEHRPIDYIEVQLWSDEPVAGYLP